MWVSKGDAKIPKLLGSLLYFLKQVGGQNLTQCFAFQLNNWHKNKITSWTWKNLKRHKQETGNGVEQKSELVQEELLILT